MLLSYAKGNAIFDQNAPTRNYFGEHDAKAWAMAPPPDCRDVGPEDIMKKTSRWGLKLFAKIVAIALTMPSFAYAEEVCLEITLKVGARARLADVYSKFEKPFVSVIPGVTSKVLLIRDDDMQMMLGFTSNKLAEEYLSSDLFAQNVVLGLKPLFSANPEIRNYGRTCEGVI